VNRYVLTGEGNAQHSLTSMSFYCWDTAEVLDLIEWMRRWNATHERKVCFYGCDIQSSKAAAINVLEYLRRRDPGTHALVRDALELPAADLSVMDPLFRQAADRQAIREAVDLAAAALGKLSAGTDAERYELELVRLQAVVLRQNDRMCAVFDAGVDENTLDALQGSRDLAMAENVLALLELHGPDAKAVYWAHNDHMARCVSGMFGRTLPPAGQHLRQRLGERYFALGFAFDHGSFGFLDQTHFMRERALDSVPGTLDAAFAGAGPPVFALDLRDVAPAAAAWLAEAPPSRNIGGMYEDAWADRLWIRRNVGEVFDGLLFVRETTAARHNPETMYQTEFIREEPLPPGEFSNLDLAAGTDGWRHAQGAPGYDVSVAPGPDGNIVTISRSETLWPHDVFALSQTASAVPWRGRRLTVRCKAAVQTDRHGVSAQLAVRVVRAWQTSDDPSRYDSARRYVWERVATRDADLRELSVSVDVGESADVAAIALVVTGDGTARFGPVQLEETG
jgi:erythromycin esterase-like protein